MKKLFQVVLVGSICLLCFSCYYDEVLDIEVPIPDNISYQDDIQPLFNQSCVSCHNGNLPPDLRSADSYNSLLNGYVVPGNASQSILYKSLLNIDGISLMPPEGQWSATKINLVEAWIDGGALDN